jgi:hypothetical protein
VKGVSEWMENLVTASDWELDIELPAAVVEVARRRAGKDDLAAIVAELTKIAKESDSWPSRLAYMLLNDAAYLSLIADYLLRFNMRLQERAVRAVMNALSGER